MTNVVSVLLSNQCTEPETCEQLCARGRTNVPECFCKQGFKLDGNGENCSGKQTYSIVLYRYKPLTVFGSSDVDECANNNDNNCNQLCNNTEGSFVCDCQSGYKLNADGHTCDG